MSNIDLYPNPAFVEAIRKDGYNKFGFDVFLWARSRTGLSNNTKREKDAFEFIKNSIEMTDKDKDNLKSKKGKKSWIYEMHKNTIDYLLKYYNFLIKEGLVKNLQEGDISASYDGGIVTDYIEAVNSKEAILYTKNETKSRPIKKWPDEMSSWFPEKQLLHNYSDFPPMLKFGGPKQRWKSWYFNLILVSFYRDKGFDYESQKMFMNWKGNPLNR